MILEKIINYFKGADIRSIGPFTTPMDYIKLFISFFQYFTFWVLSLEFLYYIGVVKNIELTLVFLHLLVIVGAIIFIHIHPKYVDVKLYKIDVRISGQILHIIDLLTHWLTFVLLILVIKDKFINKKKENMYLIAVLPVLYRILFSPKYYYGVEDNYVVISYALVLLVFYMVNEYFFNRGHLFL